MRGRGVPATSAQGKRSFYRAPEFITRIVLILRCPTLHTVPPIQKFPNPRHSRRRSCHATSRWPSLYRREPLPHDSVDPVGCPGLRSCYDTLIARPGPPGLSVEASRGVEDWRQSKLFPVRQILPYEGRRDLVRWRTALPSGLCVTAPSDAQESLAEARRSYQRYGEYYDAIEHVRVPLRPRRRHLPTAVCDHRRSPSIGPRHLSLPRPAMSANL
jgi:hypothetical protein